jgi:NAD(P)-dependent dehydrogenase (short-subunit alcohol dehydrogenase family)
MPKNIVVIGSSGGLGREFVNQLALIDDSMVFSFSRAFNGINKDNIVHGLIDYNSEDSIQQAADQVYKYGDINIVIVATGILHNENLSPEKSLNDLSFDKFAEVLNVNAFLPAIIAKHFIPKLNKKQPVIFAALSARVGSINDNKLGGWYSYRASKAALNMIIKNLAIETARSNKFAKIIGLHPGTVDSNLSKPFQSNVIKEKLFTPEYAVNKLLRVIGEHQSLESGALYAWDGQKIEF